MKAEEKPDSIVSKAGRRALLVLAAVYLASCAAPAAVGYKPKSEEETYVIQTVTSMADAVNAGDVGRLMSKVSTGYYRGYAQLEQRVATALQGRLEYALSVTVEEITFDEPKVHATVSWEASWISKATGGRDAARGRARLTFMKSMGIKLIDQSEETLFGF